METEEDTQNTTPLSMALLDNTGDLLNGQTNKFMKLDMTAWSQ